MKELRVVLGNKTILTTGRKGPDFTPFKETPANLLKEMTNTKPTPVFKYADNLGRAITVEELKTMLKLEAVEPKKEIKIEDPKEPIKTDITDEENGTGETIITGDDTGEDGTGTEGADTNPDATGTETGNNGQSQKGRNRR